MLGLTIHTTADDIAKRLSFLTLGFIVTDAHFNKGVEHRTAEHLYCFGEYVRVATTPDKYN